MKLKLLVGVLGALLIGQTYAQSTINKTADPQKSVVSVLVNVPKQNKNEAGKAELKDFHGLKKRNCPRKHRQVRLYGECVGNKSHAQD